MDQEQAQNSASGTEPSEVLMIWHLLAALDSHSLGTDNDEDALTNPDVTSSSTPGDGQPPTDDGTKSNGNPPPEKGQRQSEISIVTYFSSTLILILQTETSM